MSSAGSIVDSPFPAGALVPKAETGVLNFLQKYPEYDGRDVTIAIFDSGVDPRATGLQTLCDGRSIKVVERFDCSGCGDVDMSKKVTADGNGFLTGLSGRKLKLTGEMIAKNSSNGEYRIGLKSFVGLYPSKVRENHFNAVKRKTWDGPNKVAIADISRKINEFEAQNSDATKLTWDKKLIKDDLDGVLDMLNNYEKMYMDIRTAYDCVLYPTENGWQAVVDLSENGDLETGLNIGEYTKTHEIKNLDEYLSISINVHDEGNVLEVVGMCSSHGTHVASIASGNHGNKDIDGCAPNAKIVSLTIGDGRLGSMETGTALVRAMMKVMELCKAGRRIDVINMSYGEHSSWSNTGPLGDEKKRRRKRTAYMSRIGELMSEVVNKYGVVWVASAGNHGPALCTVGTPPDIAQPSCIGVGAYVSPQMMEAEYAMREKLPANVYTWTSRDPCIDGGQGVTICSPGGAITSVPQFTMSKSQLMNGTSMAAPHAAGAIALLISGLKQKGIPYSPFSIKRAVCATANKLSYVDPFAQGSGLLNVEKAFEHLVEHRNASENMLRFSVRCGVSNSKGIHIRQGVLKKPFEYNVIVEPVFFNDKETAAEDKFNFNVRLNLISSQPFVQCGSYLDLSYSARSLLVKVDPSGLPPGVHTAVVRAFDSECIDKGSLFEIPVTVVQPHVVNTEESRTFEPKYNNGEGIEFQPNTIQRDFILVPDQASWAVLRMRSTDKNRDKDVGKFFVHTVQLQPKSSCRQLETMKILAVNTENDTILAFKCEPNCIIELCIAKYWSNYGNTHLKYSLEFHGVRAISPNAYMMHAARGVHRLDVSALGTEDIQPSLTFKTAVVVMKPTESKISPLSATRDVIPEGRQIYQNQLTYALHVVKANEVSLHAPIFNSILYESEYESQLWMIFDCNKAMIACGDAHSQSFYTKLEKGDYTVRLQIRHEKRDMLEKISEATMLASFKMANALTADFYDHYNLCVTNGRKYASGILKNKQPKALYVAPFAQEKLSKASLPSNCAWLSGSIILGKDENARKVDSHEFLYLLQPSDPPKKNGNGASANASSNGNNANNGAKPKSVATSSTVASVASTTGDGASPPQTAATPAPTSSSPKKNKTTAEEYMENLRDFQCSMITKCELEKAEKIYEEVIAAHPKHLVAHVLMIQNLESSELKALFPIAFANSVKTNASGSNGSEEGKEDIPKLRVTLERIVQLADLVISETDKDALLAFYGLKSDARPDAAKIKTNMDKQKGALVEAYAKKGIASAKLATIDSKLKDIVEDLDNIYTEIIKFVDATDSKVIQFSLWHAYAHEHYGRMAKYLQKMYEEKRNRENFDELALAANALKFNHLQTVIERLAVAANPQSYRPF